MRTVLALSLLVVVCGTTVRAAEPRVADLVGVWQMHGYGRVLDISPERLVTYDITDVSCVRRKDAEYDRITRSTDRFTAFEAGGITRYSFERLAALPDRCREASGQPLLDPVLNFWVLWHGLRENYAFFGLRRVNWDDMYVRFRPRITASTTQEGLFAIFSEMLAALNDGHVSLEGGGHSFSSGRFHEPYDSTTLDEFIVHDLLKDKARHGANGNLTWGWVSPGVGYVNVASMYLGSMPLPTQIALTDQAMTQVVADLGGAKALIVDARFNTGGYDAIALRIIGYLTRERRLAFTKKAVEGGGYTDTQEVYFEPQGKRQFTGPIYYLQSDNTVSAGEIFSLAMMARPNVVRVGTPTYGIFSDALEKKLPNGWGVGVSNEIYAAVDGNVYEGRGIPPNIAVTVAKSASFPDRMRLDIDTALALIGK